MTVVDKSTATGIASASGSDSTQVSFSGVSWTGKGDGKSWTDPANWSGGRVPHQNDDVTIAVAEPVIIITGQQMMRSLSDSDPLSLSAGSLAVGNAALTAQGASPVSIDEEVAFSGAVASFTDADPSTSPGDYVAPRLRPILSAFVTHPPVLAPAIANRQSKFENPPASLRTS